MLAYLGLTGAYLGGWYVFWRLRLKGSQNRILTFHDICDGLSLSITRSSVKGFSNIMRFLSENGFAGKSLGVCEGRADIALTFDDGWQGFSENAFPVLQRYGFSGTVFVISDYVGKYSRWDYRKKRHMGWEEIRELAGRGIEFASHSASHVDLRGLDRKRLRYEIEGSKKRIEDEIGCEVKYFSYPFGRFNETVIEAVREAGYQNAYTLSAGGGDFAVPRIGVYLYDTPYSVNIKLGGNSWVEGCKNYVNNRLAGGTIIMRKLLG